VFLPYDPENAFSAGGTSGASFVRLVAQGITDAHSSVTGANVSAVKIVFLPYDPENAFSAGGTSGASFVRLVGLVKGGRDGPTRAKLLAALAQVLEPHLPNDVAELTLIENRPEDTVRFAGDGASEAAKEWAAQARPAGAV